MVTVTELGSCGATNPLTRGPVRALFLRTFFLNESVPCFRAYFISSFLSVTVLSKLPFFHLTVLSPHLFLFQTEIFLRLVFECYGTVGISLIHKGFFDPLIIKVSSLD